MPRDRSKYNEDDDIQNMMEWIQKAMRIPMMMMMMMMTMMLTSDEVDEDV